MSECYAAIHRHSKMLVIFAMRPFTTFTSGNTDEELEAKQRDGMAKQGIDSKTNAYDAHFQGQGMYARPRKPGSRSPAPPQYSSTVSTPNRDNFIGQNGVDRAGNVRTCHNCGDINHLVMDCRKPRNLLRKFWNNDIEKP